MNLPDDVQKIRGRILERRRRFVQQAMIGLATCVGSSACAPAASRQAPEVSAPTAAPANPCNEQRAAFQEALAGFTRHERERSWTAAACDQMARQFEDLGEPSSCFTPAALYNAGAVYERCGQLDRAIAAYVRVLAVHPDDYAARARLAVCRLEQDAGTPGDGALEELEQRAAEPGTMQPELLAVLAFAHLRRYRSDGDAIELSRAAEAVERGLMVDENHARVLHAQIVLRLVRAERHANRTRGELAVKDRPPAFSEAASELLAQTCSAALRRAPNDAAIHEVCGVAAAEQGDFGRAAGHFERAIRLEPERLSSRLDVAATRLALRDLPGAQRAYRAALAIEPENVMARLGLATALRHDPRSGERELNEAAALLDVPKGASGALEALYNRALLQRAMARTTRSDEETIQHLVLQRRLLEEFLEGAKNDPRMAPAVSVAEHELDSVGAALCLIIESPYGRRFP